MANTQGRTYKLTADTTDGAEIIATILTPHVEVFEDASVAGWPTGNFAFRYNTTDDWVEKPLGSSYVFKRADGRPYEKDDRVAYVKFVSATSTLAKVEPGI